MWDLLSCPVGTVRWPQAQLSMPGAAEAALSCAGLLGMAWTWCLLQQQDTASPAQAVAHRYITCTPTHTDMHQHTHTLRASTRTLMFKHSLPSTCTMAHYTQAQVLQLSFHGAHAKAERVMNPKREMPQA